MKSSIFTTAVMGLVALVTAGIAAVYYPWPEAVVENDMVNKPLFEAYDVASVRSISIVNYDDDRNGLQRIKLVRKGEKWVIPAFQDFIATNAQQIGLAANALTDLTVLENRSNDQSDHYAYGVVDPGEYETATNRSSLGTMITLENRTGQELASLIVGPPLPKEGQQRQTKHFVRVPGQPNVYVVNIEPDALATDFTRWVSPNLLQLGPEVKFESIQIKSYRIQPDAIAEGAKQWSYFALMDIQNKAIQIQVPGQAAGELVVAEPTQDNVVSLNQLGQYIGNIRFTDVRKKSAAAAAILKRLLPEDDTTGVLDSLKEFGFVKSGFDNGFKFIASDGEVTVRTDDGVAVSILIGNLAENPTGGNLTLQRYVMLYALADESLFPEPEKPAANEDPELANQEEKEYLRKVADRDKKIEQAKLRARELNQAYADWIYVVPEDVVNGLRPDLKVAAAMPAEVEKTTPQDKAPGTDPEASEDDAENAADKQDDNGTESAKESDQESDRKSEQDSADPSKSNSA